MPLEPFTIILNAQHLLADGSPIYARFTGENGEGKKSSPGICSGIRWKGIL